MKTSYKFLIGIIVLVIILGGLYFYKINGNSIKENEKYVKIGVILPLTGSQAVYGQGIKEGLDLALNEINANESNKRIELIYEDNSGDVAKTVSAAHKLIEIDRVSAIISGPSQHSVVVSPIAQKEKTVQFTIASQTDSLRNAGDYIFMSDGTLDSIGAKVAELMYNKGYRKAGVISAQYNDACVNSRDAFIKRFKELGGEIVDSESFSKDETDFSSYLTKLKSANPDAIYINGMVADDGRIVKKIGELKIEPQLFAHSGIEDKSVIELAGNRTEGIIFATFQGFPTENFIELNKKQYSHYPLRWSAESYDGLKIISQAIDNINGEVTSEKIRDELSKTKKYQGESGTIIFDSLGNAQRNITLKTIKGGKFVKYE